MDSIITRTGTIFDYDVARDGRDTNVIKDISGTSSASGGVLLINNADVTTYTAFRNQSLEMLINAPVAPVAGQNKIWGLKNASDVYGSAYFQITGATFQVVVNNIDGTTLYTRVILWNSTWTAAVTKFRISMTEHDCIFAINDSIVAVLDADTTDTSGAKVAFNKLAYFPLAARVTNGNSDNLALSYIRSY